MGSNASLPLDGANGSEVDDPLRVPPLVVVPGHKFHEVAVQGNASLSIKDARPVIERQNIVSNLRSPAINY